MDTSTICGFSRASSWSSVAVVGGGVGGAFTMLYDCQKRCVLFAPMY